LRRVAGAEYWPLVEVLDGLMYTMITYKRWKFLPGGDDDNDKRDPREN
jgi:hypothetical protein